MTSPDPSQPGPPEPPEPSVPAAPPAPPAAPSRSRRTLVLLAAGCFLLPALVIGLLLWLAFGYRVPSSGELDALCRVNPGAQLRHWDYIIIHHSASDFGDAASIDKYHRQERGWQNGLGYDFVVDGPGGHSGRIEVSDRWKRQIDGAHCKAGNMNSRAIGVCFIGNFQEHRGPAGSQLRCGAALVRYLARRFNIPPGHVLGHREVPGAQTDCPGRFFPLDALRSAAGDTVLSHVAPPCPTHRALNPILGVNFPVKWLYYSERVLASTGSDRR